MWVWFLAAFLVIALLLLRDRFRDDSIAKDTLTQLLRDEVADRTAGIGRLQDEIRRAADEYTAANSALAMTASERDSAVQVSNNILGKELTIPCFVLYGKLGNTGLGHNEGNVCQGDCRTSK